MKICTLPIRIPCARRGGYSTGRLLFALAGTVIMGTLAQGQQSAGGAETPVDQKTVQMLLQRIEQLEGRVTQLEAERQQARNIAPAAPPAPGAPATLTPRQGLAMSMEQQEPAPTPAPTEQEPEVSNPEPERMDMSKTLMRIRGFGDVNLQGADAKNGTSFALGGANIGSSTTSFSLGQLNLFVSSDISEKFKFLSEIVFEAGPDNIYGLRSGESNVFSVDLERYLLQYSYNDYFNLSVGRYQTAIG